MHFCRLSTVFLLSPPPADTAAPRGVDPRAVGRHRRRGRAAGGGAGLCGRGSFLAVQTARRGRSEADRRPREDALDILRSGPAAPDAPAFACLSCGLRPHSQPYSPLPRWLRFPSASLLLGPGFVFSIAGSPRRSNTLSSLYTDCPKVVFDAPLPLVAWGGPLRYPFATACAFPQWIPRPPHPARKEDEGVTAAEAQ